MRHRPLRHLMTAACLMAGLGLQPWALAAMNADRSATFPLQHGAPPIPGIGGDLLLQDVDGRDFTLKSLGDRPALVFFSFTRSSSVGPLALLQLQQTMAYFQAKLPPAVIFVTLDPLNDDGPTLARYLAAHDPRIIGLTGHPSQVYRLARRYAVGLEITEGRIEHSAMWYLVNAQGEVKRVYDIDTPPHDMARDIQNRGTPARLPD
jgi:cytochrome oxidase Cu insertion factor (SCO1/SenC/PrrC family)